MALRRQDDLEARARSLAQASQNAEGAEELQVYAIELELQHDELVAARHSLENSVQDFQSLFEMAPVGYVSLSPEGTVLRSNRRAQALFGAGERSGWGLGAYLSPVGRISFEAFLNKLRQTEGALSETFRFQTPRGEASEWTGNVNGVLARDHDQGPRHLLLCIHDVSVLQRALREAENARAQLRMILEEAPDGIAVFQFDRLAFVNRTFCEFIGQDPSFPIERAHVLRVVESSDRETFEQWLLTEDVFETRPLELKIRSPRGPLDLQLKRLPLVFEGMASVLVIARDVTESRRLAASAETSSRLASLGLLVAGVGHEVANPLSFMLPNLEFVVSMLAQLNPGAALEGEALAELRQAAHDACVGAQRVARIVEDLRTFHATEKGGSEPSDVNEVVSEILKLAGPKLGQQVTIERDLGRLPRWVGLPGRLGQVLLNLILNASQAMPDGRPPSSNRIVVRTWFMTSENGQGPGEIAIEVADNGRGIPPERVHRVFEPFFSMRSGGSGLGLSVCNNLVAEMGGRIDVRSELGEGTAFTVRLPLAGEAQRDEVASFELASGKGEKLTILFIDDEAAIRRVVTRILEDDAVVLAASSVEEASRILQDVPAIDLVISDLVMAGGDGVAMLESVRKLRPDLIDRFVIMSGITQSDALPVGVSAIPHLPKPFVPSELRDLVHKYGRRIHGPRRSGSSAI